MSDPDVYLAVPLDEEDHEVVNRAVHVGVNVSAVSTDVDGINEDEWVTTICIADDDLTMALALEILKQVKDNPEEGVEVRINAKIKLDEFQLQCERLTKEENQVMHQRFIDRMEET